MKLIMTRKESGCLFQSYSFSFAFGASFYLATQRSKIRFDRANLLFHLDETQNKRENK